MADNAPEKRFYKNDDWSGKSRNNKKPERLEPNRRDARAPQNGDIKEKQWHKVGPGGGEKVLPTREIFFNAW
ncbi:hypothetical protein [Candidatus Sodalis sp. SoCistrobi]|uniref:hypothetical protein n=1 Tax=Candidatus Sodalis sp. SoCistrobi TaxID=1922216 RepID=UPI000F76D0F7|nr:hypothetical protein [Candidatus Sodalis sp. SoCistrobi]